MDANADVIMNSVAVVVVAVIVVVADAPAPASPTATPLLLCSLETWVLVIRICGRSEVDDEGPLAAVEAPTGVKLDSRDDAHGRGQS